MLWTITAIILSYLLGSLPTAYLFGRILKGIDIRKHGSGNIGATNAMRVLGKRAGITVLGIDILKGFIAVVVIGDFFSGRGPMLSTQSLRVVLGLSCICGHNWTAFLNFKGGKGVATTFGVLIGLAARIPGLSYVLILAILTWFLVFAASRIISLASVLAGISLPVYMFIFHRYSKLLISLSLLLCVFVIFRHKANLKRLLQGKEPRLSFKKSS